MDNFSDNVNKTKNMTQTQALLNEWDKKHEERQKLYNNYLKKDDYTKLILAKEKLKQTIIRNATMGIYEPHVSELKLTGKKKKDKETIKRDKEIIKQWYKENYSDDATAEDKTVSKAEDSSLSTVVKKKMETLPTQLQEKGLLQSSDINSAENRLKVTASDNDADILKLSYFMKKYHNEAFNEYSKEYAMKDKNYDALLNDFFVKKAMHQYIEYERIKNPAIVNMSDEEKKKSLLQSDFYNFNHDVVENAFVNEYCNTPQAQKAINAKMKKMSVNMEDCSNYKLFRHIPKASDIVQGDIGDCYFLAALASKAEQDPDSILKMMHENIDGTVTVRFYNHYKINGSDISEPIYVTVKKSRPYLVGPGINKKSLATRGELWVSIIEKAFAASKLHSKYIDKSGCKKHYNAKYDFNSRKAHSIDKGYKEIAGGSCADAFSYLEKEEPISFNLHNNEFAANIGKEKDSSSIMNNFKTVFADQAELEQLEAAQSNSYQHDTEQSNIEQAIILIEEGIIRQLKKKYDIDTKGIDLNKFLHELREHDENLVKHGVGGVYRTHMASIEDVMKVTAKSTAFTDEKQREVFATALMNILQNSHDSILNFRRFSGKYTKHAEDIFYIVKQAEGLNKRMTAGTFSYLSIYEKKYRDSLPRTEKGMNGENASKGVYEGHAYSVLGTKERDNKKFIVVRNPWGKSEIAYNKMKNGKYDMNKTELAKKNKDADGGIFLIELNDFITRFGNIAISGQ